MDQWYYVAGVIDPDVTETISMYLSDGVTLFRSDSVFRDAGYATQNIKQRNGGYDLGVVLFGGSRLQTFDDVTLYDEPFDDNSFLVQVLGIPEPTSLAFLGLDGLLLARHRQHIYGDRSLGWYRFALEAVRQSGDHARQQGQIKEMGCGLLPVSAWPPVGR